MTIFTELATVAVTLLDQYGEDGTIELSVSPYDATTRQVVEVAPARQVRRVFLEVPTEADQRFPDSLATKFARVGYLSPTILSGAVFEPAVGQVLKAGATRWVIGYCEPEIHQGVAIVYIVGVNRA